MQTEPHHSQRAPTEWSGTRLLVQKWLARRCDAEAMVNLLGGVVFLFIGLIALTITSCVIASVVSAILMEATGILRIGGFGISLFRPVLFGALFLLFMALSILYAYKTRWGTESAAKVDLGTAFSSATSLAWEVFSAGPILLIISGQDLNRYFRLSHLDVPHVTALLIWLYDKGGRAKFAEISFAFPALNAVRVLPQLRDLPGINWWPDDAEISLADELKKSLAEMLGRGPKTSPAHESYTNQRAEFKKPIVEVDNEIVSWYTALNLPLFATLQEVKKRYRKLAKIHHPDARQANRRAGETASDEQMKRINEAYHNILKHSQSQAGSHN